MRPYIICHMVASIDGRIDCSMVSQISGEGYYTTLESLGTSSKLSGRVTAALECSAVKEETSGCADAVLENESIYKAVESEEYTIIVDTHGRLQIASNEADGHPLLVIMSENVSEEHLEMLRKNNVSWIATGKERIDLHRATDLLGEQFGVKRLIIVGGGSINGGFLEAGLIDEVSLLLAPGIDGRKGQIALFDGIADENRAPVNLTLESVEQLDKSMLWMRYRVMK